jgi:hypothetical protein
MILIYCDICGEEKASWQVHGVSYIKKNYIALTSADDPCSRPIGECSKHICNDCLEKLGWSEKEENLTK